MNILLCYLNIAQRRFFPIGFTILVNELAAKGHNVQIFDTSFYKEFGGNLDEKRRNLGFYKEIDNEIPIKLKTTNPWVDLKKMIQEFKPGLVGISAMSIHFILSKKIAEKIKEINSEIPIILGGIHPTVVPTECISEDCFDMLCLGEGEEALVKLADNIEKGIDYSNIDNLWVKNNGEITKNNVRTFRKMDELPFPDWDLFDPQHIWGALYGKMYRMAPVELSRGCPYKCTYCVNETLRDVYSETNGYHRRKPIEKAVEEMVQLNKKYDIEMFYIMDESFLATKKSDLEKLADLYLKKVKTPFLSQTRPETVTDEKARIVSEMGCKVISMGVENGNEEIRRKVLNRQVTNEQIVNAFEILRKYGIKVSSFNMLGVPGETKESILETIELNRLCKPDSIGVTYFFPYKGTSLRDLALKEGMITGDEDPGLANERPTLDLPTITKEELVFYYQHFVEYCRK